MAKAFTKNLPAKLVDAIIYARRHRAKIIQPVGNDVIPQYHALFDRVYPACQSALKFTPSSAPNIDPLVCGAGEPLELVRVAETVRPRVL